jgi:hypothetical protein
VRLRGCTISVIDLRTWRGVPEWRVPQFYLSYRAPDGTFIGGRGLRLTTRQARVKANAGLREQKEEPPTP